MDKNDHQRSGSKIKRVVVHSSFIIRCLLQELKSFLLFYNYHALQFLRVICSSGDLGRNRALTRRWLSFVSNRGKQLGNCRLNNNSDDARVAVVIRNKCWLKKTSLSSSFRLSNLNPIVKIFHSLLQVCSVFLFSLKYNVLAVLHVGYFYKLLNLHLEFILFLQRKNFRHRKFCWFLFFFFVFLFVFFLRSGCWWK